MERKTVARKIDTNQPVLSVEGALALLGGTVSRSMLYKSLKLGLIPHRRLGKRILIGRERLLAWIEGADPRPQPGPVVGDDRR
jgi:hypothetical protein